MKSDELRKIPYLEMFKIRGVFAFALAFFFIKDVLFGIYYWYPTFLQSQIHFSKDDALDIFSLFSTGTFIGCVCFGLISDLFSMRSPAMLAGLLATTILMFILAFDSGYHAYSFTHLRVQIRRHHFSDRSLHVRPPDHHPSR